MPDAYLIEVDGRAVGLVMRDGPGRRYRFHAAIGPAFVLDGRLFRTPAEAEKTARTVLDQTKGRARNLNHAA